jgi:hypothetical protein
MMRSSFIGKQLAQRHLHPPVQPLCCSMPASEVSTNSLASPRLRANTAGLALMRRGLHKSRYLFLSTNNKTRDLRPPSKSKGISFISQRFLSSGDQCSTSAASRDAVCTHLRRIIYAHLPMISSSMQWRTNASQHTRALWQLIDDNVLVASSRNVQFSSPAPNLQQLSDDRHQLGMSEAYARLVQVAAHELISELFKYSV